MNILLTGATGYIGNRLLIQLINEGHHIWACVRDKKRFQSPEKQHKNLHLIEIDFLESNTDQVFPKEIDIAYYLIHSMSGSKKFMSLETSSAKNFINALNQTQAKQIIYLSGIDHEKNLSQHLSSRKKVQEILSQASASLTTLKAGIIVGSGSSSFEIIRDLVEKLPILVTPKWVETITQPIAIRDVLKYLVSIIDDERTFNNSFDIGGPDVLTYRKMLGLFAQVRGLKRTIIPIPVLTPRLSSYWLYFVTSTSYNLAYNLVSSLKVPVKCEPNELNTWYNIEPISYKKALELAFDKIAQNMVVSTWKDALANGSLTDKQLDKYVTVPKYGCFKEHKRRVISPNLRDQVVNKIFAIGGINGWYFATWLWKLRGFIDKIFGGVGLRRGRKNPDQIKTGDFLDFWRVVKAERSKGKLLLYAEMKVPGEAWLEFKLETNSLNQLEIHQIATFRPKGLNGRLYWYSTKPLHFLIFNGMINAITEIENVERSKSLQESK